MIYGSHGPNKSCVFLCEEAAIEKSKEALQEVFDIKINSIHSIHSDGIKETKKDNEAEKVHPFHKTPKEIKASKQLSMDDFVKKTLLCERDKTKPLWPKDNKSVKKQMSLANYLVNNRTQINMDQLSWMDDLEGDQMIGEISSQEITTQQKTDGKSSKSRWQRKLEEEFEKLETDLMMEGVSQWSDFSESGEGAEQLENVPEEFFDDWGGDEVIEKSEADDADDPVVL
jgi:membrane-associated HD superfamily phosphohydrolase